MVRISNWDSLRRSHTTTEISVIVAGWDVGHEYSARRAKPYIDLFQKRAKDLVNTKTVADVAILRSFTSIAFNPAGSNVSTILFEQSLIQAKIPFAIIFDRHLGDLSAYKVLVLADQDALSDAQVASIRDFVKCGRQRRRHRKNVR